MVTPPALPPLPDPATVSVVVPARCSEATVAATLRSALQQEPPVTEVIVACPPDDDATRAAVAPLRAADRRVRLVDVPSGRTPDALNAAIAASSGQVIVRLDAHAELPAGYVARAVETLRRTGAGNVGGRQVPEADSGFAAAVAPAMASPAGAGGAAYRTGRTEGPVDTVYLGVFRREALLAVGAYDPRMTRNQDAELNLRLVAAGHQVWFDPALSVAYRPRADLPSLASQYWQYGRWRRATATLHPGSLRARQLVAPALVTGLVVSAVGAAVSGRGSVLGVPIAGYLAGLVGAGAHAAPRPTLAAPTAAALGTMHLAWGLGFLAGPPRDAVQPPRAPDVS
jgi:succinoglycan biosynthesis protein ExoA